MSTRQDWIAAAALLAGLFATYAIPAATTGASAARAVAAMAIAALIALAVARAPFTFAPRVRSGFVFLVGLSLWYIATRAWAIDPAGSMVESSRVAAFVLMAWAACTAVGGTGPRRLLLAGIGACGLFVSAEHVADLVRDGAPAVRVAGELGYWNATAVVAMTLVPMAVALAGGGRRALVFTGAVLIPIAGITAVATASRGALVALVIGLVLQAALDPDHRGGLPRALVAAAALGAVVVGLAIDRVPEAVSVLVPTALAAAGFGAIRRRRDRVAALRLAPAPETGGTSSGPRSAVQFVGAVLVTALAVALVALVYDANESALPEARSNDNVTRLASTDDSRRLDWWEEGLEIWRDAPIVGQGGGAFDIEHVDAPGDSVAHVHSLPLEVLLETGIVGFLLMCVAAVQFLRSLRRGRRSADRALAGGITAMLAVQASIDWTLSLPQVLAVLAIAGPLSLPFAAVADEPEPEPPSAAPALTMLVALAIATTAALTPMLATILADQAASRFDDGDAVRAAELSGQSMILVPSLDTLILRVGALQTAGRKREARAVMRANKQVWFTRLEGLRVASELFANDRELNAQVSRRMREIEQERAAGAWT